MRSSYSSNMMEESFLLNAEKTKADEDCTIGSSEQRKDETNEDENANLVESKNTNSVEKNDVQSKANLEITQKCKTLTSENVLISSSLFKERKIKKLSQKRKSSFSSSAETTESDSELSDDTRKEIEKNNDFIYNFVDKLPTGQTLKISSSLFPKRTPKKSTVQKNKSSSSGSAETIVLDADKLSDGIKKEIVDDKDNCSKFKELPKSRLPKRIYKPRPQKLCDICDKVFADSSSFAKHKRVHLKENPYKCEQCYKSFRQSNDLKRHMRIHTNDLRFSCDQCSMKFSCRDNLKRHKVVHEEEKPFKCRHCSSSFTRLSELKTHTVIHTRKELFACEMCAMTFSRAHSVRRHVYKVHFLNKPSSKNI